ncbi:MAG: hypothetical protein NZZ60_08485 [Bacteroidia bacterium]|nr:hypothetical protein [Bacteroidia bacterium]
MPKFTTLTLSAREIAQLVSPYFGSMRFWIEKHLKPPSDPFPTLPADMDRLLKDYTKHYWENHQELPLWFEACQIEGAAAFAPSFVA